jgi:hypothetical protein
MKGEKLKQDGSVQQKERRLGSVFGKQHAIQQECYLYQGSFGCDSCLVLGDRRDGLTRGTGDSISTTIVTI